jgi:hypothetical protein
MHEHEQSPAQSPSQAEREARGAPQAPAQALQAAVGNRAMARMVQRMETSEAVDALEKSLAPGVLGAERQVISTMAAFSSDPIGFDKVGVDFEKKTKEPLAPKIEHTVPPPKGFFPGISGEKAGE